MIDGDFANKQHQMLETRNNCFEAEKHDTTLRQAKNRLAQILRTYIAVRCHALLCVLSYLSLMKDRVMFC